MRLRLPLSLRSALLACSVLFTTVASASVSDGNLGNVMYIGDSITHGVNSGSWRWAMHKISRITASAILKRHYDR